MSNYSIQEKKHTSYSPTALSGLIGNQALLMQTADYNVKTTSCHFPQLCPIQRTVDEAKCSPLLPSELSDKLKPETTLLEFLILLFSYQAQHPDQLPDHRLLKICRLFMHEPANDPPHREMEDGLLIEDGLIIDARFPRPPLKAPKGYSGNHSSAFTIWERGIADRITGSNPIQAIKLIIEQVQNLANYPGANSPGAIQAITEAQQKLEIIYRNVSEAESPYIEEALNERTSYIHTFRTIFLLFDNFSNIEPVMLHPVFEFLASLQNADIGTVSVPDELIQILEAFISAASPIKLPVSLAYVFHPLLSAFKIASPLQRNERSSHFLNQLMFIATNTLSSPGSSPQSDQLQQNGYPVFESMVTVLLQTLKEPVNPSENIILNILKIFQGLLKWEVYDPEVLFTFSKLNKDNFQDIRPIFVIAIQSFLEAIPTPSPFAASPVLNAALQLLSTLARIPNPASGETLSPSLYLRTNRDIIALLLNSIPSPEKLVPELQYIVYTVKDFLLSKSKLPTDMISQKVELLASLPPNLILPSEVILMIQAFINVLNIKYDIENDSDLMTLVSILTAFTKKKQTDLLEWQSQIGMYHRIFPFFESNFEKIPDGLEDVFEFLLAIQNDAPESTDVPYEILDSLTEYTLNESSDILPYGIAYTLKPLVMAYQTISPLKSNVTSYLFLSQMLLLINNALKKQENPSQARHLQESTTPIFNSMFISLQNEANEYPITDNLLNLMVFFHSLINQDVPDFHFLSEYQSVKQEEIPKTPLFRLAMESLLEAFPTSSPFFESSGVHTLLEQLSGLLGMSVPTEEAPISNESYLATNQHIFQLYWEKLIPNIAAYPDCEPLMHAFETLRTFIFLETMPSEILSELISVFINCPLESLLPTEIFVLTNILISTLTIKNVAIKSPDIEAFLSVLDGFAQRAPVITSDPEPADSPKKRITKAVAEAVKIFFIARNKLDYTYLPGNVPAVGHDETGRMEDIQTILEIIDQIPGAKGDVKLIKMIISNCVTLFDTFSVPRGPAEEPLDPEVINQYLLQHIITLRDAGINLPDFIFDEIRTTLYQNLSAPRDPEKVKKIMNSQKRRKNTDMKALLLELNYTQDDINELERQAEAANYSFNDYMEIMIRIKMAEIYS